MGWESRSESSSTSLAVSWAHSSNGFLTNCEDSPHTCSMRAMPVSHYQLITNTTYGTQSIGSLTIKTIAIDVRMTETLPRPAQHPEINIHLLKRKQLTKHLEKTSQCSFLHFLASHSGSCKQTGTSVHLKQNIGTVHRKKGTQGQVKMNRGRMSPDPFPTETEKGTKVHSWHVNGFLKPQLTEWCLSITTLT